MALSMTLLLAVLIVFPARIFQGFRMTEGARGDEEDSHTKHLRLQGGQQQQQQQQQQSQQQQEGRAIGDASFPIDIAYCWGGASCAAETMSCDNGELRMSLRSVARFAPWVRSIFVLMNPPLERPSWLADDGPQVQLVDRCSLFPEDEQSSCPTSNTYACQAIMHRLPNMSEHFIYMDDDFYLVNPVQPDNFFDGDGKPYTVDTPERSSVYADTQVSEGEPHRVNWIVHAPLSYVKSGLSTVEDAFPEWYKFVRSHKTRFNGIDEDMMRIYAAELADRGIATRKPDFKDGFCELAHGDLTCLNKKLSDRKTLWVNTNNVRGEELWGQVEKLLVEHNATREGSTSSLLSFTLRVSEMTLPALDRLLDGLRLLVGAV